MSSYLKRRVALILAVAIISAQLSACKKLNEVPVQNEAPVATVQQENTEEPTEATEPQVGGLEWLQENLENLKQSLLDGDYAKVVDQLLEMRDELKDNARYNALLYIAYSGKGDKDKANDLLNNKNLNRNEFMDAFLEFTNALKGNAGAKSAEQQLMDAMMHLAQKDKTAYNAAVRVGQNIQNENPSDPNAYVVMYIAALAGNDKAAMKDVLSQAKANGISAEVLSTATVEYIERVNVTDVTTEDAKKGIESSTSFNGKGETLKIEETVTNKDGTKTLYTWADKDRTILVDEVKVDKKGNILSSVHYTSEFTIEEVRWKDSSGKERSYSKLTRTMTGRTEAVYKNGKLESLTVYGDDDTKQMKISIDPKTGTALSAKQYVDGVEQDMPEDLSKNIKFTMDAKGKMTSFALPYEVSPGEIGYKVTKMEYYNGYGSVTETEVHAPDGTLLNNIKQKTNYDLHKWGIITEIEVWRNTSAGEFDAHVKQMFDVSESTLVRDSNTVTAYDKEGNVTDVGKFVYDENNKEHLLELDWIDDKGQNFKTTSEYNESWNETIRNTYAVGQDGNQTLSMVQEYEYGEDGVVTSKDKQFRYDESGKLMQTGTLTKVTTKDGVETRVRYVEEDFDSNGKVIGTSDTDYVNLVYTRIEGNKKTVNGLADDGKTLISEKGYKIVNGKEILTHEFEPTFENGQMVSEKDTYYNLDGTKSRVENVSYAYDQYGQYKTENEISYFKPDGSKDKVQKCKYDAYGSEIITEESSAFDENGEPGKVKKYTIKSHGQYTFVVDENDNIVRQINYSNLSKDGTYSNIEVGYDEETKSQKSQFTQIIDASTGKVTTDAQFESKDGKLVRVAQNQYTYSEDNSVIVRRFDNFKENGMPGNLTVTEKDADNRIKSSAKYDYDTQKKLEDKTYVYDSETGDLKGYTQTEYDAEGNVTGTKNYDPNGNELPEGVTLNLIEEEKPVVEEEVIEENQFTEEEPTEPEQPTEEVKPTEPEQPTEEVKPTEPEQPTEEVKPTEPEQPTEEVKPTEPEQPTEEVKPTEPEQPTEEVKPTEPEKPTEEVKPTAPETPAETETKTEDKAPAESAPSTPASAGDSGSASTPAAPAASAPASSAPAAPAASAPASAPAASSSASSAPAASAPSSAPAAEG